MKDRLEFCPKGFLLRRSVGIRPCQTRTVGIFNSERKGIAGDSSGPLFWAEYLALLEALAVARRACEGKSWNALRLPVNNG